MRKKFVFPMSVIVLVGIALLIVALIARLNNSDSEYGKLAVKYLYNFQTVHELDANMEALRQIVSDDVYEQLTIDKTDRALNVYLKFKGKPVVVNYEEITDSYIVYSLETEAISSSRKFVFFFEVEGGRITEVREGELIDFNN